jgi:hypothetical protein
MLSKESMNLVRQIAVFVAAFATILFAILANVLPLNGVTTAELGAQFDVLFVPAPYASYVVWTVIYVGLAAYAIYQVRPAVRNDERLRSLDFPFLLSSVAIIEWLLLWHFQHTVAAAIVSLVALGAVVTIYRRLRTEWTTASMARRWFVHRPFSVYLGFMTIGAMANIGFKLEVVGWTGFGLSDATWFMLGVLFVLGVAGVVMRLRRDVAYLLTLMWAFIGIAVERAGEPIVSPVAWTATAILALMVALSVGPTNPEA